MLQNFDSRFFRSLLPFLSVEKELILPNFRLLFYLDILVITVSAQVIPILE